jgi:hypothetical protein
MLNVSQINPILRQPDFRMLVIVISAFLIFLLLTIVKIFYSGYYNRLFYVLFRQDYLGASFAESNASFNNAGIFVLIASLLSVSASFFTIIVYTSKLQLFADEKELSFALFGFLGVSLLFFLKWMVYSFWGWLVHASEHTKNYLSLFFQNIRAFGILIFPIFILVPFVGENIRNVLIYTILISAILLLLYNYYAFWRYSVKIKFFNHYAILYFCTFEILPILVLWKLFG